MNNPLDSKLSQNLGLLLARVPLGAFLLLHGYHFIHVGVSEFVNTNRAAVEHYLPALAASIFLHALPFVEVAAGAFLVLGIFARIGGFLASIVLLTAVGVFMGIAGSGNSPFNPFIIFFGLSVFLCCAGPGGISLDRYVWGRGKRA